MKKILLLILLVKLGQLSAQDHSNQKYYEPTDPQVKAKLAEWQNMRFGLLMHWGTYSQWGIVESWSICPEDEGWCERRGPYSANYFEYVKAYENLQTTFNPIQFNPERWAKAAKEAGMKYMVFTTKHHDGFALFDTKFSDYKITSTKTPFSKNPRANITHEVFNAFRKEGLWVGAYFSKPDWHCQDYWWPKFPPYDRNPNYDLNKYPEKWNAYKKFTQNQINELLSEYGKVDILWLDGGWVQPMTETSPRWGYKPVHQDIEMDSIALWGRKLQPGLIVVDRAVEGPNQNYLTPEQQIPDKPLPYPWETCMTMGGSWSWVKNEHYKSKQQILVNLCKIVSRGGNYLLNIAPGPNGEWDSTAYQRLQEIGVWMKKNGNAIYSSKPIAPFEFKEQNGAHWVFTQSTKDKKRYAMLLNPEKFEEKGIEVNPTTWGFNNQGFSIRTLEGQSIRGALPMHFQIEKNCGVWVIEF
ncbi:MAG: alpha-L-fucosidase [Bacteroidia bacterium]|nr:alpha-L-fucosidase [Bacteroidia bacterium]